MILGFKKQFKAPIMDGTKIHTIRLDKNFRWKPGVKIQMATGIRSKHYQCFKESECSSIQRIFMSFDYMLNISIGNWELSVYEKEILAKNDGFKDFKEFEDYWYPELIKGEYQSFSGRIIHWTNFRYTHHDGRDY